MNEILNQLRKYEGGLCREAAEEIDRLLIAIRYWDNQWQDANREIERLREAFHQRVS